MRKFSTSRFNLYKVYSRSEVIQKHILIRLIFNDGLTWSQGSFTSVHFNSSLQFNLQKKSLKQLLSVKPPQAISDNLNQTEKRRALRKPMQKVLEMKTGEDEKFIKSITEIIVDIIKSNPKQHKGFKASPPRVS